MGPFTSFPVTYSLRSAVRDLWQGVNCVHSCGWNWHAFIESWIYGNASCERRKALCSEGLLVAPWCSWKSGIAVKNRITKSETRMTASVLKQDPNTWKVQGRLFIRIKHNMPIFRVIPFIKLQNDTYATVKRQLNGEKRWKMRWSWIINFRRIISPFNCCLSVVL